MLAMEKRVPYKLVFVLRLVPVFFFVRSCFVGGGKDGEFFLRGKHGLLCFFFRYDFRAVGRHTAGRLRGIFGSDLDSFLARLRDTLSFGRDDVDVPAGEFCGKAYVLSTAPYRERLLVLGYGHRGAVFPFVELDAEDGRWRERLLDKVSDRVAPLDDVDALAAELAHHGRDAHASLPDQGADRVHVRVDRNDGDLGAASRFARKGFDDDASRGKLGRLEIEQFYEKLRMRAGKTQVNAAKPFINRVEIGADTLAHAVAFTRDLFLVGNDAGRAAKVDENSAAFDSLYDAGNDLALFVAELVQDGKLLRFADFLDDDLLGRLRRNAAEVLLRLKRKDQFAADSRIALDAPRVRKQDMFLRIKSGKFSFGSFFLAQSLAVFRLGKLVLALFGKTHQGLIDHGLHLFEGDRAGVHIELRAHDLAPLPVFFLIRSRHRRLYGVDHRLFRDAAIREFSEN